MIAFLFATTVAQILLSLASRGKRLRPLLGPSVGVVSLVFYDLDFDSRELNLIAYTLIKLVSVKHDFILVALIVWA